MRAWIVALVLVVSCSEAAESPAPRDAGALDAVAPAADAAAADADEPVGVDAAAAADASAPDAVADAGFVDAGRVEMGVVEGCVAQSATDFACTLAHDGLTREYYLHVPAAYAQRPASGAPLVFNFHGLASSPEAQIEISRLLEKSDVEGFIAIHPRGTGVILSFNAGFCCRSAAADNVDDTGFTLAMIERVAATLAIDRGRVYATGLSNGGHMAYRLACDHAGVFAAVAPVAGVTARVPCQPSRPVPVLHFHGTDDNIVGYGSGSSSGGTSAPETVRAWAERNGCSTATTISYQQGEVTCEAYTGCGGGSAAELCTITGGGHTWPGGDNPLWLGHATQDISATDYLWSFFEAHR